MLVSPSTVIALKERSTARFTIACQTGAGTPASQLSMPSMVAMLGWIIPEPLAMPPMRTRRPPRSVSRAICLSTRSVVRIARAAPSPPSELSAATRGSSPASRMSMGIGTPITPVEQISTSSAARPNR